MSDDFDPEDSNLVQHARRELERIGMFDPDSDYSGMLATAVMELIEKFAAQGHSGMSASMTMDLFSKLGNFEALTPLTDDKSEWMEVGPNVWQNTRQSSAFSDDGGKTYHIVGENRKWIPRWILRRVSERLSTRLMYPQYVSQMTGFIIGVAE
jgi:hypothetical protein